jgi:hypothetical protein
MSGMLVIGRKEQQAIEEALTAARERPTPWSVMQEIAIDDREQPINTLTLDQRKNPDRIAEITRAYPTQRVQLGTYEVAISFEEQPAGIFKHLSISSRNPDKVPNEHAVAMVVKAFGFSDWPPTRPYRVWVEEYKPGHMAINLVELEA